MQYFVRKFENNKWISSVEKDKKGYDIDADPCTSCLRTSGNTLSVWKIDCDIKNKKELEQKLLEISLAMVTSANKIDQIQFIYFPVDDLKNYNYRKNPGNTPIARLSDLHEELINLTIKDIVELAELYIKYIKMEYIEIIPKDDIKKKVEDAINNNELNKNNSSKITNKEIRKMLGI